MPSIELKKGRDVTSFEYDAERMDVLGASAFGAAMSDAAIGGRFDEPIGSKTIEEIVGNGDTVLIVVPDATREVGCGQVVNLLVRRLIANGTNAFDIRMIFATGIHRKVTDPEKAVIVTPFIAQRIKMLDHDPRDLMQIVRMGETSGGIPVELNRALTEHDHIVLIGGVSFHYFAGFTGGRKLICPGLASSRTVSATHKLAFDCDKLDRRDGVGTGLLDGNAVHEAFVEAAGRVAPSFAITTTVNDRGEITDLHCGDWIESHRAACDAFLTNNSVEISDRRDLVIVSCGGFPHDINLIQAHKALDAASYACKDGGKIILVAECSEGLGRSDLIDWFAAGDSRALAAELCAKYQVNGQTAWSLLKKAERFDIGIVSDLSAETASRMGLTVYPTIDEAIEKAAPFESGYIIPAGAKCLIRLS
jgi:nickel-dependent lactate racemase